MSKKLKIGILGVGMVGEPIRKWFEELQGYMRGKDLFLYDIDPKKGYFDDVNKADAIFVALPTPSNPDGSCNVSLIEEGIKKINDNKIVIVKSTVEPGTVELLQKKYPKKKFVFNPEFLTESQAWLDFVKPDRQILGYTKKGKEGIKEVQLLLPQAPFMRPWSSDYTKKEVSSTEAELAKYAANIFGYIKVIYGNLLADVCEAMTIKYKQDKVDATVEYENVRELIAADPRIGPAWLNVEHGNYCGAGGYCFPKDMKAFIAFVEKLIGDKKLIKADPELMKIMKHGLQILKSIHNYNIELLKWQGLTIEEVSRHNKEIVVQKRRGIRKHSKK